MHTNIESLIESGKISNALSSQDIENESFSEYQKDEENETNAIWETHQAPPTLALVTHYQYSYMLVVQCQQPSRPPYQISFSP